jgi:hypothetical protein
MRWSLKLSELDFIVEHRPGSQIGRVDALSRHVGPVMLEGNLNKETVQREQEKDDFCVKHNPGAVSRNREFFRDDEGVIYRREPHKHQIVIPRTLIQRVIEENHNPKFVAHPGIKRTYDLISLKFWWPGMRRSIGVHSKV